MKRKRGRPELIPVPAGVYPELNTDLNQLRSDLGTQTSDLAVVIARIESIKERAEQMAAMTRITMNRIVAEKNEL